MHNYFWFDYKITNLLFEGLNINSIEGLLLICFILTALAASFEAVKLCQISVKLKSVLMLTPPNLNIFCFSNDQSHLLREGSCNEESSHTTSRFSLFISEVLLYVGQVTLGYILMLGVMSYNIYLCIATVIGAGFGYWFFGLECSQTRMKMVKMKVPCQHCIQNPREDSAVSTLVENESVAGSSGVINESASAPSSPAFQTKVEINSPKKDIV